MKLKRSLLISSPLLASCALHVASLCLLLASCGDPTLDSLDFGPESDMAITTESNCIPDSVRPCICDDGTEGE